MQTEKRSRIVQLALVIAKALLISVRLKVEWLDDGHSLYASLHPALRPVFQRIARM